MNDSGSPRPDEKEDPDDKPSTGPSLTLLYSLIVLALLAASAIAALIVYPFYKGR
ncbi:hypothetical protein SBA5_30132 [Candidatus Sulfotelmatomonas gaucii]|uniref:Uncharacterized protein n=1 Tax=Candidatus Sulfuritelmatomonas gaucii TaxID=2043161 RepID=A0A2N9LCB2_9BACT|nr:hypothetical protein SBA5_30132 [Candidatus Sulfotelmatomonas gaucii]